MSLHPGKNRPRRKRTGPSKRSPVRKLAGGHGSIRHKVLFRIYRELYGSFGPQQWWPGETRFEIIVGAILTQNTNWKNVEKAIKNLKAKKLLSPGKLHVLKQHQIARIIKPAGFFNVKAKRLKNFLDFLFDRYGGTFDLMEKKDTWVLRSELLGVNGIGPETADSILLYAFNKPVFVVDAYTKRIFSRHRLVSSSEGYQQLQELFHTHLHRDEGMFNEYHALIVTCAKRFCRSKPDCSSCPLAFLNKEARYGRFAYRP